MSLKVITVVGTRPEIIRLSRVMPVLDEAVDHYLLHTGQNYDYELNEIFFSEMALRPPDEVLSIDTTSLGKVLGGVLIGTEEVLERERPDAMLVLGDTNSCIAAVVAKRMGIPVYHMEAGNRCWDENVPEETNRRIIDHTADFNLAYTEHARRNLLAEGLHPRRVFVTGSPMREVLDHYVPRVDTKAVIAAQRLAPKEYLVASVHREENVDDRDHLLLVLETLRRLRSDTGMPLVVSTHPRTRNRLTALGVTEETSGDIRFLGPFGFFEYIALQMHAYCVVSDSGTISEESAMLGFPAVTLRNAMERPEALDAGTIMITGLDPAVVSTAVELVVRQRELGPPPHLPWEYTVPDCSRRVVNLIVGTARLHRRWANLGRRDPFWLTPDGDRGE